MSCSMGGQSHLIYVGSLRPLTSRSSLTLAILRYSMSTSSSSTNWRLAWDFKGRSSLRKQSSLLLMYSRMWVVEVRPRDGVKSWTILFRIWRYIYVYFGFSSILSLSTTPKFSEIRTVCATSTARLQKPMMSVNIMPKMAPIRLNVLNIVYFDSFATHISFLVPAIISHLKNSTKQSKNEYAHVTTVYVNKSMNYFMLLRPTQLPIQMQWWSIRTTHRPHFWQWCVFGGFIVWHSWQLLRKISLRTFISSSFSSFRLFRFCVIELASSISRSSPCVS